MGDFEIVVEYQSANTIEKYGLRYENDVFCLTAKQTDCLAKEKCGITVIQNECCSGTTGCC